MSELIIFTVPTVPVAQPRQRHRVVNVGGRAMAMNYTPKNDPVNTFKAAVQLAASQAYSGPPLDGPLEVCLTLVFPRPSSMTWKSRPMPRAPKQTKPDVDNCFKSFADALNKILWNDDGQIAVAIIKKVVCAGDESPRVEAIISRICDAN